MDKNKLIPVAAALAAATILTACDTTTSGEPVATPSTPASAAPSSTTFANAADAADADRAARARAGLPNSGGLTLEDAETAARRGLPFVFGMGTCSWLRLPDTSLWALHDTTARTGNAALVRDHGIEAAWKSDPDYEPGRCRAATGIPTADDPGEPEPYRWTGAYDTTFLRWNGKVFIVPGTVGVGLALKPTN